MTIKGKRLAIWVLAAGVWMCFGGSLHATPNAETDSAAALTASDDAQQQAGAPVALKKFIKPQQRHLKKQSSRKGGESGQAKKKADPNSDTAANAQPPKISPAVANAQAAATDPILPTPDMMAAQANGALNAMSTQQDVPPAASPSSNMQLVSADELNEVDRSLTEEKPSAPTPTLAMMSEPTVGASASSNTAWDQTSLIGKMFIGFGGLLTLASAARMLIA